MNVKLTLHADREPQHTQLLELEMRLAHKLAKRIEKLQVVYQEGGLILHGSSRTYHCKQLAQHALLQATDLPLLVNAIVVQESLNTHETERTVDHET